MFIPLLCSHASMGSLRCREHTTGCCLHCHDIHCEVVPRRYRTCHVTVAEPQLSRCTLQCRHRGCNDPMHAGVPKRRSIDIPMIHTYMDTYIHVSTIRKWISTKIDLRRYLACGVGMDRYAARRGSGGAYYRGGAACTVDVRVGRRACLMLVGETGALFTVATGR